MSTFLTLQGVNWNVATKQAAPKIVEVGYMARQIDGSMARTRRALKREWKFQTVPLSPTDALVLQSTLLGLGHHWSFDSSTTYLYSDKGLLNASGTGTYTTTTPSPKFGTGCIEIASGAEVGWDALIGVDGNNAGAWSAVVWFYNGTSWDCYAMSFLVSTSTCVCYKNGTLLGSSVPGFIIGSPPAFELLGKSFAGVNQISYFDDLVVFPYLLRNSDLATFSAETAAFSPLDQIAVGGDLITGISPNAPSYVYGSIDEIEEIMANLNDGNGLYDNAQIITFGLKEP
jgi:hypothetical protein